MEHCGGDSAGYIFVVAPDFIRGDADGNGVVDGLTDGLFILSYSFVEGTTPPCMDAADTNNDGTVSGITDGLRLLAWGFVEGAPPAEPFGDCGEDSPSDTDTLGCAEATPGCE